MKFRLSEDFEINYEDYARDGIRAAILARSGAGKSNLAALFAEQALEQGLQVVVIEPIEEYYTLKELYDAAWVGDGGDLPLVPEAPAAYVRLLERGVSTIISVSTGDEQLDKDFVAGFLWSLYTKWRTVRRPILLIVEEADTYAPQMWSRSDRLCLSRMALIAKRGRKLGINMVIVSQRPADIHKSVISQANLLFIGGFKTTQDLNSVKQLSSLLHLEIPTDVVATLQPGEFFAIAGGEARRIKSLIRKTKHGGETPNISQTVRSMETAAAISELSASLEAEKERIHAERDEVTRLRREVEDLRAKVKEYEMSIQTLKIVKEIPIEIKGNVAEAAPTLVESSTTIPEILHRCRYPGAVKVYSYLRSSPEYHTLKDISANTGLGRESIRRIITWMRRKGLVKVKARHMYGCRDAIRYVAIKEGAS